MSYIQPTEISDLIKSEIEGVRWQDTLRSVGRVVSVRDGIVTIVGLADAQYGELLALEEGHRALVLNLEFDAVGAVVLGAYSEIREGSSVYCTGEVLSVPVGHALLGRVVNPLGEPLDGLGAFEPEAHRPIEVIAPGVMDRASVNQPLSTGIKSVDVMTPVGKGQRELIIGDRQTGKTAIAIDTIINQKGKNVFCIYVAIGQKASTVFALVERLRSAGALAYTTVVVATASDAAALHYVAPYAGCAMGEFFRDRGEDALIVYDDLSKHAVAYRHISLLLRRPPGREAYPGDVFYLHSRLLERAARVSASYVAKVTGGAVLGKTGSLTALPIIETLAGDLSAFVPTNVISITDGQIFLDASLFRSGLKPAVNSGLSVSRVGGAAQAVAIRKLGSMIRLVLAQYRELEAFSQFATDLDESTQRELLRGQKVTELLKQAQYAPLSLSQMVLTLVFIDSRLIDRVEVSELCAVEQRLHAWFESREAELAKHIEDGAWSEELYEKLKAKIESYLDAQG